MKSKERSLTFLWKSEKKCVVCQNTELVIPKMQMTDLLVLGSASNINVGFITDRGKDYFVGVTDRNDNYICPLCLVTLIGLENHFDAFFPKLMSNPEAIELARRITPHFEIRTVNGVEMVTQTNDLFKRAINVYGFRPNNYFPARFIEEVQAQKEAGK